VPHIELSAEKGILGYWAVRNLPVSLKNTVWTRGKVTVACLESGQGSIISFYFYLVILSMLLKSNIIIIVVLFVISDVNINLLKSL
jgi:hypothetical protein